MDKFVIFGAGSIGQRTAIKIMSEYENDSIGGGGLISYL